MSRLFKIFLLFFFILIWFFVNISLAQEEKKKDVWEPFKFFVGKWEGKGEGQDGVSKGKQEFEFIFNGKFLQIKNKTVFEPQEKNPQGETHEDLGLFSYDYNRKKFVFRQFHIEGFVNQYVLDSLSSDGKTFEFITESIENIPTGWRAKLVYKILNENEFEQSFELASPGKDFECYSKGLLKRVNK